MPFAEQGGAVIGLVFQQLDEGGVILTHGGCVGKNLGFVLKETGDDRRARGRADRLRPGIREHHALWASRSVRTGREAGLPVELTRIRDLPASGP